MMNEKYGIPAIEDFNCVDDNDKIRYYKMILSATDYEVIKAVEKGTVIPEELKVYRQNARDEINKIGGDSNE